MAWLKRLRLPLLTALGALVLMSCLHLAFNRLLFREIARAPEGGAEPPARPGQILSYAVSGTWPGLSDQPVSWEEGKTGRDFFRLLEGHTYASVFLLPPRAGGVAASTTSGCSPRYTAYWDGLLLWLPVLRGERLAWQGYLPSSPAKFGEEFYTLCNSS
ncbi:MAG: hypothetical protein HFF39_03700 [Lawsonibacter sp.]|nr:hypothetical protein [Lawsonibacter sp.]